MVMSDREKRNTAYHEGGHALIAAFEEQADPLHKVTIIPRGRALGLTQQLPLEDKYSYSKEWLEARLAVMMGGRLAAELCLDQITSGASNDFERATTTARRMVCEWGMSDLGTMTFGHEEGEPFLGRDFTRRPDYSEDTARKIDAEVNRIVTAAYQRGKQIVLDNRPALDAIAAELLEKESLDGEEVYVLIEKVSGKKVPHTVKEKREGSSPDDPTAPAAATVAKGDGSEPAPPGLVPAPV